MPFAEIRPWVVTPSRALAAGGVRLRVWCRLRQPLPTRGVWAPAALTYIAASHASAALDICRVPGCVEDIEPRSYEFSMRFHRGVFDVNDWLLLDSAITYSTAHVYSVDTHILSHTGDLLATSTRKTCPLVTNVGEFQIDSIGDEHAVLRGNASQHSGLARCEPRRGNQGGGEGESHRDTEIG
ncbi:thioesterase family protein [Paraburkholderia antibiotica]